jgi:hypothetical protein
MARVSIARKDTERKREMLTLAMVVARARRRVEAARGGPVVARGEALEAMTEPPVIVKDTAPELSEAHEGENAGFCVKVTGTKPIQYQWYKNGKLLRVTTATKSILSLQNVQMVDAGEYHCVATNADGEVTSRIARLVVSAALGFVEHPDEYVKCEEGETARIKVEAKGKPPLEYNWFKDQKELNFDESCTSRVLVLSKVAPTDSGYYHCVISNGTDDEESGKCQLVVTAGTAPKKPAGGSKGEAAESGLSPHSNGDDEGNDDGGEESGRDDGEMSRPSEVKSGRRNGDGGRSGTEEKEGGRSKGDDGKVKAHAMKPSSPQTSGDDASSDHTRVTHDDAGSDGGGDAITEEPLPPPVVTAHPASAGVQEDESVEFRVSATGSGLAFQWLHNGEAVPNETEATLALLRAGKEHAGEYVCEVTGAGGASVRSDVAKLEVRGRQKNTADDVQAIGDDDDDLEQISA